MYFTPLPPLNPVTTPYWLETVVPRPKAPIAAESPVYVNEAPCVDPAADDVEPVADIYEPKEDVPPDAPAPNKAGMPSPPPPGVPPPPPTQVTLILVVVDGIAKVPGD
jgi:hypothetical protein